MHPRCEDASVPEQVEAALPDLTIAHRTSPALVVRLDSNGLAVVSLTQDIDLQRDVARFFYLRETTTPIPIGTLGLCLLETLGRRRVGVPNDVIEETLNRGRFAESCRDELSSLFMGLVRGRLLHRLADIEPARVPPSRVPRRESATVPEASDPWIAGADPVTDQFASVLNVGFVPGSDGFEVHDHDGSVRAVLSTRDLLVAAALVQPRGIAETVELLKADPLVGPLNAGDVRAAMQRLAGVGLLRPVDRQEIELLRAAIREELADIAKSARSLRTIVDEETAHFERTGRKRILVVAVDIDNIPLPSLGFLVAYAKAHLPAAALERVRFAPLWFVTPESVEEALSELPDWPTVFLFSCYTWNHEKNLQVAGLVERELRSALSIFGGPDVPKREADAERYFAEHSCVDIAVRGEGEATFCDLLDRLTNIWESDRGGVPDLGGLGDVNGITYRVANGHGLTRTPDRERIADLDSIPSPYLTGLFDHIPPRRHQNIILESNRGCPYGCTFCDWGSATLSRLRRFDLERVKQEMEWAAKRGMRGICFADANFGMLDRDIEIAEHAANLRSRYGLPSAFHVNYAKSRPDNLARLVQVLAKADLITAGLVALQTNDEDVLKAVKRSNIKLERYYALASEFRAADLPLYTDVIVGLPGSTVDTVRRDFQFGIDCEVHILAHPTQLLVNSPMNDPEYRAAYGIVAEPTTGGAVVQTSSYSVEDWREMMHMCQLFYFAERRGLLRQLATYVRVETGMKETAFYDMLRHTSDDERWPHLSYALRVGAFSYIPPGSWVPLLEEIGQKMVDVGVPDDPALATVLAVQHALFPGRWRQFPVELQLAHDYATWHERVIETKRALGDDSWAEAVPALRTFGPGVFPVADPYNSGERVMGSNPINGIGGGLEWELGSPVARTVTPGL